MAPLPDLILYGRPDCGLCDEARTMVVALLAERARTGQPVPTLVERDIEADEALERAYFAIIPVLELGPRRLDTVTSLARIRRMLGEVLDGDEVATAR